MRLKNEMLNLRRFSERCSREEVLMKGRRRGEGGGV